MLRNKVTVFLRWILARLSFLNIVVVSSPFLWLWSQIFSKSIFFEEDIRFTIYVLYPFTYRVRLDNCFERYLKTLRTLSAVLSSLRLLQRSLPFTNIFFVSKLIAKFNHEEEQLAFRGIFDILFQPRPTKHCETFLTPKFNIVLLSVTVTSELELTSLD